LKKIFVAPLLLLVLTGCSAIPPIPSETKTQTQIEKEFLKIADDSCKRAQSDDVLERMTNDAPARIIVLSRNHAYKNYSAIYIDNKNVAQVIYELDLTVCGPSNLLSMQQEANHDNSGDYEHHIKLNSDGTYTWTAHVPGEAEGVMSSNIFSVKGGLIIESKADNPAYDRTIEYGPIAGTDLQILKDAVDEELTRLG
jgi:hypothetical protein